MVLLTEEMIIARSKTSNLEAITKLNCWGCELSDVSILRKMTNVTVLSLSVNSIDSLEVFQFCTKLQDLYMRKNNVSDLNQVCYLQGLPELKSLWLQDNPCASNDEEYRLAVIRALPHLKKLDDLPVETSEIEKAQRMGRPLVHPDLQQEIYYESDDDEYSGQQIIKEERNSSPEIDERNNYSPEPNVQYQRSRELNNSYEQMNEPSQYTNESGDSREIYNESSNQNHRQPAVVYKYEEEVPQRQQNHRPQGILPRSRTVYPFTQREVDRTHRESPAFYSNQTMIPYRTDGELGHNFNCPTCCSTQQQMPRRPNERRTNVLNAVLCLIKELDYPNLEVVEMAVKCRMQEFC